MTRQFIPFILINDWGGGVQGRRKGLGSNSVLKFNDFLLRVFVSLQWLCLMHCGGCTQMQSETPFAAASPFTPAIANRGESLRFFFSFFGSVFFPQGPMPATVARSEACLGSLVSARKQSSRLARVVVFASLIFRGRVLGLPRISPMEFFARALGCRCCRHSFSPLHSGQKFRPKGFLRFHKARQDGIKRRGR